MHRPLLMAKITASNGNSLPLLVIPDSGADACLLPMSLALFLKLDVLNLPKMLTGGVGSSANITYYDTVKINLDNGIEFEAYVGFTEGMDGVGLGCWGKKAFSINTTLSSCIRKSDSLLNARELPQVGVARNHPGGICS
jgi:hypothetical protein